MLGAPHGLLLASRRIPRLKASIPKIVGDWFPWCLVLQRLPRLLPRLRPEPLPRMKVVEALSTAGNPAVFELEFDAAVDIELFAVSHCNVAVDAEN